MRLAFMGTPAFSVPVLAELLAHGHEIAAVYTQPARPAGRGKKLRQSPVQELAERFGLEVRTPVNFKAPDEISRFVDLDLDVAIVVAYGLILPRALLAAPRYGCLNLHASLLPRWRGAAPIHRAIMAGDKQTGVQVMQMEAGLDTGPILLSAQTTIHADDTTGSLQDRLAAIGAQLMPTALSALERASLSSTPQSQDAITYAHKISAEDAQIDWKQPATMVDCHIRGLSPTPGAWFGLPIGEGHDLRIKCMMSAVDPDFISDGKQAGTVMANDGKLVVACGEGAVRLDCLQKPGKSVQQVIQFLNGTDIKVGMMLSGRVT